MQLKDYIRGDKRGKEANRFEREAMNDPFLRDALEGFDTVPDDHTKVIDRLEKRFANPAAATTPNATSGNNKRLFFYGSVAASILLLIGFGTFFLLEKNDKHSEAIVMLQSDAAPLPLELAEQTEASFSELQAIESTERPSATPMKAEQPSAAMPMKAETLSSDKRAENLIANVQEQLATAEVAAKESEVALFVADAAQDDVFALIDTEAVQTDSFTPDRSVARFLARGPEMLKVSGKIVDEHGDPLVGVTILNRGTNSGAVTDIDGTYYLQFSIDDSINLFASYIGYESKAITISDMNQTVVLVPDSQLLSETVVIGYGTQRKSALTGAISTARAKRDTGQASRARAKRIGESDMAPIIFGEKEFQVYCQQKAAKNVCDGENIIVRVSFFIDEFGKPTDIKFNRYTCEKAKEEIENLLLSSPVWTTVNKKVTMTLRW